VSDDTARRVAGALGALGVLAGAFGAHALDDHPRLDTWKTAALYHVLHAIALAVPGVPSRTRWAWVAGVAIFSGSLYALVGTGAAWLGAVTPIGGLCFVGGWMSLAISPRRGPRG
jgi:uncharacterized membrane protein YgdD (TMEM256/DUF423 family)